MVMRNVLSATVGSRSTRRTASPRSIPAVGNGAGFAATRVACRVVRGGLPSRTPSGMSTGRRRGTGRRERVAHHQLPVGGGLSDDRVRAALARAERRERRQPIGGDRQHVALLRLVAPELQRREPRLGAGDVAQGEARAAAAVVHQLGERVREAPGADVVNRQDRVLGPLRGAAIDHLLAAPLHLGVVPLHRREVEILRRGARGERRGRPAAEADQHGRSAQHHDRRAGRELPLLHLLGAHVAEPARDHDRLVVAAHLAPVGSVDLQLEGAEVAGRGPDGRTRC